MSSQQLVELFQAQVAPNPELPPVLIQDLTAGEDVAFTGAAEEQLGEGGEGGGGGGRRTRQLRIRAYQLPGQFPREPAPPRLASVSPASPPTPRLERSLMLRGELTVPRSGYTEPYTVW